MKMLYYLAGLLAAPAFATVQIVSMTPSPQSPQSIGTPIQWTVTATDTNAGPLTFQFNVSAGGKPFALTKDFNAGTLNNGKWRAPAFHWFPAGPEGEYQIQVVAKDFTSGETDSRIVHFTVTPLVTGGTPVVISTANPLVALFSAPACAKGSDMRAAFKQQSSNSPVTTTNWIACHPAATMTFEIAGMYPSTTYSMHAQIRTQGTISNGPTVPFTTGALPTNIPFPKFDVIVPAGQQTDTAEPVLLWGLSQLGMETNFRDIATDLAGNILWFYNTPSQHPDLLTRPLTDDGMLTIQDDAAWNPASQDGQVLRQIDLAGNIVRETNTGVIQQQLLALGAADAGPCTAIPNPAPIGSACLGAFHHEAIELPNGYIAALADIEKIFEPGTQGSTSEFPVDIVGDMIVVLDTNWQVVWYFDAFQYLDVGRAAILGDTCGVAEAGCPPMFLLGPRIAPAANDWLHANSIYYWPQNGDLILSLKNQDWVLKVDYNNSAGTGVPLWTMGAGDEFEFDNVTGDLWPWFSAQHDVSLMNNGGGPLLLFDNGDTRVAPPPIGLGSPGCQPADCNSRGMVLNIDESTFTVTPSAMVNLGVYSPADGAAQSLSNGNYFFFAALVATPEGIKSYALETGGGEGSWALDIQGPQGYRAFRMASLYNPN
ncbi:MAG: aryl-sulfate sulfotransferase [Bryobacteraceae bacterium]